MTIQTNQLVSTLAMFLLEQKVDPDLVRSMLEELTNEPATRAEVEKQLKTLLLWQDDPAWFERIAAYREGTLLPKIAEFLTLHESIAGVYPEILTQFDLLAAPPSEPELELLPDLPTWAERWQQQQAANTPAWRQALGYEWQFWRETGRVVIRLLQDVLQPPTPTIAPIGVKGHVAETLPSDKEIVRRIRLPSTQLEEREVEAVLLRDKQAPELYSLLVNVQAPERWPDLAGIVVSIHSGEWQSQGSTNQQGEVQFEQVPAEVLDTLTIEVLSL